MTTYTVNVTQYGRPTEAFLDVVGTTIEDGFLHISNLDTIVSINSSNIERITTVEKVPSDSVD